MAYDIETQLLAGYTAALATVAFSPSVAIRRWRLSNAAEDYPCAYVHVSTAMQETDGLPTGVQHVCNVTLGVQTDISDDADGTTCDALWGQLRQALSGTEFIQTVTSNATGITITGVIAASTDDESGDGEADVYGRSIAFTVSTQ